VQFCPHRFPHTDTIGNEQLDPKWLHSIERKNAVKIGRRERGESLAVGAGTSRGDAERGSRGPPMTEPRGMTKNVLQGVFVVACCLGMVATESDAIKWLAAGIDY
jgi:hypothetical protein